MLHVLGELTAQDRWNLHVSISFLHLNPEQSPATVVRQGMATPQRGQGYKEGELTWVTGDLNTLTALFFKMCHIYALLNISAATQAALWLAQDACRTRHYNLPYFTCIFLEIASG